MVCSKTNLCINWCLFWVHREALLFLDISILFTHWSSSSIPSLGQTISWEVTDGDRKGTHLRSIQYYHSLEFVIYSFHLHIIKISLPFRLISQWVEPSFRETRLSYWHGTRANSIRYFSVPRLNHIKLLGAYLVFIRLSPILSFDRIEKVIE